MLGFGFESFFFILFRFLNVFDVLWGRSLLMRIEILELLYFFFLIYDAMLPGIARGLYFKSNNCFDLNSLKQEHNAC